ncbi:MAG: hypothetical protein LWX51_18030 [Deltaproteobacteria bacterium]|nr:hypothetical protein [Deltaproteobacteria bacterium]
MEVAIDSNALTYLIESMEPNYFPSSDDPVLAIERISMLRIFLYAGLLFYVLPQVINEYAKIPKYDWRDIHKSTVGALLNDVQMELDHHDVCQRKRELLSLHPKDKDCQILAEAEVIGISSLLTRDDDFIKRLSSYTVVRILYPSEFWKSLNVTPGSNPKYMPAESNPLFGKTWWKI